MRELLHAKISEQTPTLVICRVFDRVHYDFGESGTTLTLGKKLPE